MDAQPVRSGTSARPAAEALFTLSAAGEIGVSLLVASLPASVMDYCSAHSGGAWSVGASDA